MNDAQAPVRTARNPLDGVFDMVRAAAGGCEGVAVELARNAQVVYL